MMNLVYPDRDDLASILENTPANSHDFIVIVTAAFAPLKMSELKNYLSDCVRMLKTGGLLFVQGRPDYLPELGVYLDQYMNFKYWIAIESTMQQRENGLPSVHSAVLLFTKGNGRFNVKRTRLPHQYCDFCKRTLKDWGGKAHLMNPEGYVISDVWTGLPISNNHSQLSKPVIDIILRMLDFGSSNQNSTRLFQQTEDNRIDIDENYVRITKEKLAEVERNGFVRRSSIRKPQREYTKNELQLELRKLASNLGRLPTPEDVRKMSKYDVQLFFDMFPSWNKALKAARLEVQV